MRIREDDLPFTVIADEFTDSHSNQEILSVCIRYVDISAPLTPEINECLIGFLHIERAKANTIAAKIVDALTAPSLSLDPSKIRGQAYDGAAVMSSDVAGVQAKIKNISPLAMHTHCYSHCLNLTVAATCKVQEVRNLVGLINEAYHFLANSPKRQRLFELTLSKYLPDVQRSKLPGLCKTRWVERHTCFEVFSEMYVALVTFLDVIVSPQDYEDLDSTEGSWNWDKDTKVKAQGLKAALSSFQTIAVFVITKNTLSEVQPLAAKLQKRDQDILKAYAMVDEVIDNVKALRETIDSTFGLWYSEIIELAANVGAEESVPRKTNLQRNRSNVPSENPQQHYRRAIAIPLVDSLIGHMLQRFRELGPHMSALLHLIPSIVVDSASIGLETLESLQYWKIDLPFPSSLPNEVRRWEVKWRKFFDDMQLAKKEGKTKIPSLPSNLLEALSTCDVDTFPNIHSLLVIGCTLPVTSAEAERSFSLIRRLKTYLRSTMTEGRVSDLAVIAMNYDVRIPVDDICKAFVQAQPRRLFQPSLFVE